MRTVTAAMMSPEKGGKIFAVYAEYPAIGVGGQMLARVSSAVLWGIDAVHVPIEVQLLSALRRFSIVGLPDGVVREAKERVRCAMENSGYPFPSGEVIVNLAPADLPKAGSSFDLAIAAGILTALGLLPQELLTREILLGELALDGTLKPARGALAAACLARQLRYGLIIGIDTIEEASLVDGVPLLGVTSLAELVRSAAQGFPSRINGTARVLSLARAGGSPRLDDGARGLKKSAFIDRGDFAERTDSGQCADLRERADTAEPSQAEYAAGTANPAGTANLAEAATPAQTTTPTQAANAANDANRAGARNSAEVVERGGTSGRDGGPERRDLHRQPAFGPPARNGFAHAPMAERSFADVIGHHGAKRALEIAAAGFHNVLMFGPPGSGKSMLAERIPSILPDPVDEERIEVMKVRAADPDSVFGQGAGLLQRPFRAPHHTVSTMGLIGGGSIPAPGEVSLAHRGVLFLDELPHLRRDALEALREPLETQRIVVSRARRRLSFPADFMLVAAMNPCPCGRRGSEAGPCQCAPAQVQRYLSRISGPVLDRMDLQIWVPSVSCAELSAEPDADPTEAMRARIAVARDRQRRRTGTARPNSRLTPRELKSCCKLDSGSAAILAHAAKKFQLSGRGYTRILKVARTIADLEDCEAIQEPHIAEALSYRTSPAAAGL